jgi:hyperosmotically inducible periplasmic protein
LGVHRGVEQQMGTKIRAAGWALAVILLFSAGCDKADQERAHERAVEAQKRADEGARRLGNEAKREAHRINQKIGDALNGQSSGSLATTSDADKKLDHAGRVARDAGESATRKLDHAAVIAKVKAKLAADVGMSTMANVEVDAAGPVVTLRGTVSSEDQKREAERAASQVDGVTKVVNDLTVQP